MRRALAAWPMLAALLVPACGGGGSGGDSAVRVVVTTSILGDVVRSIVGNAGRVEVLMPNGSDPHEFQPSARQTAELRDADLVVTNGLGLEGSGLADSISSAKKDGVHVFELGPELDPIRPHGHVDPHVWFDPARMARGAELLGARLADALDRPDLVAAGERYAARLRETDRRVSVELAQLPADRRLLVTNHDVLEYFAARYGFKIVGTVIPGGTTLGASDAASLAALARTVRDAGVPAVFAETSAPQSLSRALASEAGHDVAVVELFTEALGPRGSGAEHYPDLLLTDARRIAEALA